MLSGCLALLAGTVVTIVAIETHQVPLSWLAPRCGRGLRGGCLPGRLSHLTALAPPEQRAGVVAAIFTLSYLAFSVPVVIAGLATTHFGLHRTALVYCGTLAVMAAAAAISSSFAGRHTLG